MCRSSSVTIKAQGVMPVAFAPNVALHEDYSGNLMQSNGGLKEPSEHPPKPKYLQPAANVRESPLVRSGLALHSQLAYALALAAPQAGSGYAAGPLEQPSRTTASDLHEGVRETTESRGQSKADMQSALNNHRTSTREKYRQTLLAQIKEQHDRKLAEKHRRLQPYETKGPRQAQSTAEEKAEGGSNSDGRVGSWTKAE